MEKNTENKNLSERKQSLSNVKKIAKLIDESSSRDELRMFLSFFSKPSV